MSKTTVIDYQKLNEGLGGAYERIAYTNIIKNLAKEHNCHSMLELNATYIAGIPGFNSCLLAQAGYDVTVAVRPRDYEDTLQVWEMTGLKAHILKVENDINTPFKTGEFDFVWNHLAFEQYKQPLGLIKEMTRISNKVVLNLTLNPLNYGYWIHWLAHRITREPWDHGYTANSTNGAMIAAHKECGLRVIGKGFCDAPPWMDTVNAVIGNSMSYANIAPKNIRDRWVWCSIDPKCQGHKLVKLFLNWEKQMPYWFGLLASHHLYVASVKSGSC